MEIIPVQFTNSQHTRQVQAIRFTVFVEEQSCDPTQEMEEIDKTCQHWLAMDTTTQQAIGTARCIPYKKDSCAIGRVAVLKEHRGRGAGAALTRAALDYAHASGYRQAIIHAQQDKEAFYAKLGFIVSDPAIFYEENMPHVKMHVTFPTL